MHVTARARSHVHTHISRKTAIKSERESPFTNNMNARTAAMVCSGCCAIVDLSCPASTLQFNVWNSIPNVCVRVCVYVSTSKMKENVMVKKNSPTSMEHEAKAK